VAILGEMAELGEHSARYHGEVRALLGELGIEVVVGVGDGGRAYVGGGDEQLLVPDVAAFSEIAGVLRPGDAILVKASRAVGLEGIPALIEKHSRAW
jgi:UDP-N-acetylmuramoyl-tripeptide--D-alanyl-D-alanine ligase